MIADRHAMNVAAALAIVHGNRGYPRHHSQQLSRPDELLIAATNLIADYNLRLFQFIDHPNLRGSPWPVFLPREEVTAGHPLRGQLNLFVARIAEGRFSFAGQHRIVVGFRYRNIEHIIAGLDSDENALAVLTPYPAAPITASALLFARGSVANSSTSFQISSCMSLRNCR